jgi:amino acid permease
MTETDSNDLQEALLPPSTDNAPNHQPVLTITSQAYDEDGNDAPVRIGSIASARFNILSTMVGGGCLSLPLAFQQSGNSLMGPLLLVLTGIVTDFCFRLLVASAVHLTPPDSTRVGKDSYESITQAAFGPKAYIMSQGLVFFMCFFGAVGYSVLLRDMMEPLNDAIVNHLHLDSTTWFGKNLTMFAIILIVTPSTTLQTLTALKNCGATSMLSLFILGSCIVYRSIQCQVQSPEPWYSYLTLFPESPHELLNVIPLYISCFVCHYNILPVHNELQDPTKERVSWWLRSTTWFAIGVYMTMGFAGSAYGHCTPNQKVVHGNILLDFDEADPLLMVGRMCLALTITLAFPMLVIPGRDIALRNWFETTESESEFIVDLQEPLLQEEDEETPADDNSSQTSEQNLSTSFFTRLSISICIFWTAGVVASLVSGIEVVWDLLGSSLSILLSYLIPCGSYLIITKDQEGHFWSKTLCWILIIVFAPLMVISTVNAVENTFSQSEL